jgi:hypothetical protein
MANAPRMSFSLMLLIVSLPQAAQAALPPISQEELARQAELIVDARVAVTACGVPIARIVGSQTWTETQYLSTLEVLATIKGTPKAPLRYRGIVQEGNAPVGAVPPPPLGTGWVGRLYLTDRGDGIYEPTYQGNTPVEDKARSSPAAVAPCQNSDGGAGDAAAPDGASDAADPDARVPADASADASARLDTAADSGAADARVDGGGGGSDCSCALGARRPSSRPLLLLLTGGLALWFRRRRRR